MIQLTHVTKRYRQATVLNDITLTIDKPGIYCLLGRNGAGKTTLMKSIAGYQNITDGSITVNDMPISTAAMDTGVSYVENFARHFNLPVSKLLGIASKVNPSYDAQFAADMMERFELDPRKKFKQLSLGMKTMVSTIVCLASNRPVVLLDEPVLGFDAVMRVEFYDMLVESARRSPRIIIVSTHIIEEIEHSIDQLIILDRGRIRFFDAFASLAERAFSVSGLVSDVEHATDGLNVIGRDAVGGLATAYIFDIPPQPSGSLEVKPLSLQDFFVHMVGYKRPATAQSQQIQLAQAQ